MENKQSQGYTKTLKDRKLWDFTQYSYCVHPNFLSRTLSKIKHAAPFQWPHLVIVNWIYYLLRWMLILETTEEALPCS